MTRAKAIAAAKRAYRLFSAKGHTCSEFNPSPDRNGYVIIIDEWAVYLDFDGSLRRVTKKF